MSHDQQPSDRTRSRDVKHTDVEHIAAADCERCRPGPIAQPVNTVSSLALVLAGVDMWRRSGQQSGQERSSQAVPRAGRRRGRQRTEAALALATIAAGFGSVAYHGPGTALGRHAHDTTLLTALGLIVIDDVARLGDTTAPDAVIAAVPFIAAVGALPALSGTTQALVGSAAVLTEVAAGIGQSNDDGAPVTSRTRALRAARLAITGAAAAGHLLGRSGHRCCNPDSVVQPHALWHLGIALSLWIRSLEPR